MQLLLKSLKAVNLQASIKFQQNYSKQVVKVYEHNNSFWNKKKIAIAIEESNSIIVIIKWLW